jgi:hypothetical protein
MAMMRVLPGGIAAGASNQCPECAGRRCARCLWEGTREGWQGCTDELVLAEELKLVGDAQLSETTVRHAYDFVSKFRSVQARYVAGLLRELMRRAGVQMDMV